MRRNGPLKRNTPLKRAGHLRSTGRLPAASARKVRDQHARRPRKAVGLEVVEQPHRRPRDGVRGRRSPGVALRVLGSAVLPLLVRGPNRPGGLFQRARCPCRGPADEREQVDVASHHVRSRRGRGDQDRARADAGVEDD